MIRQAHCYIKGDVIGVGFRAWCAIQAKKLGVTGWVRNVFDRPDKLGALGGVEAVIQGEEETVLKMINRIKEGPPVSQVDEVEVEREEPKEVFDSFVIQK